ncbi:putative alpha/beta hydrolase fold protein [Candidatus Hamiltonella defensa 5AT (Acyrthosiphon pisum)]|uniref:Alpha/beta hydrolase fold protein n=2 Tax=Candidatus Williamhamiltonella defendens TaxID=138072 RepID=C4K391_HAMD5|nr:putative alpha/beta hydrolase fold protein [Candidatus Hamiltonella defensa 5AT (Acyrthosiphon pisum)]
MNFAMKLNFILHQSDSTSPNLPIILIHGLFGNLDNLSMLGRDFQKHHDVIQLDLRNYGLSPHSPEMNYFAMAQDVLELLDQLKIEKVIIIGHSMGGKVAMTMTALIPEIIKTLVIIDIAPVVYPLDRHNQIFMALNAVTDAKITQRHMAGKLMRDFVKDENIILFLLKSFHEGIWRFNVPVLWDQYQYIAGWEPIPTWQGPLLFLCGALSPYIKREYREQIAGYFPIARSHVISGCGHSPHAEKPDVVLRAIQHFFSKILH